MVTKPSLSYSLEAIERNGETYLADITDKDSPWLGIIDITHEEGLAEITENSNCETIIVNPNKANIIFMTNRIYCFLLVITQIGCNDYLCFKTIYIM